jgi:hypothetical protein
MTTKKRITEPAPIESVTPAEKYALDDAVRLLIDALGLDERNVKGIDIRDKVVRTVGNDNVARAVKLATPLKRYERDAEGRVIE